MSAMCDYLENVLIDHILRTTNYTPPATLYFALFVNATNDAGGGTEVAGGNYARVAVTRANASFKGTHGSVSGASSGTGGQASNGIEIQFPAPSGNWGTITNMAVFDAASAGNMLFHGQLGQSKTVNSGDAAPKFAVDQFTFTLA